jgi:SAM-dependent methyltransferase
MYQTNLETYDNPCSHAASLVDGELGGTSTKGDPNTWNPVLWDYLIKTYNIQSMLDCGCGVGTAQLFFERNGIKNIGFDGTEIMRPHHFVAKNFNVHNLNNGPFYKEPVDLFWSCDVFEHIDEKYLPNIMETINLSQARILAFAAAPEGAGGWHHVNCKNPPYWIEKLVQYCPNYEYDEEETKKCHSLSSNTENGREISYFLRSGLIFKKKS